MSDFLGSLVQRSLSGPDRMRSGTELAPRLPGLFEPTGGEVIAPSAEPFSQESSASEPTMRSTVQNEQGPHPTVVAPMKAAMPSSPPASQSEPPSQSVQDPKQVDEPDGPITEAPIHPTEGRSQVLHPEMKQRQIQNKQHMTPVPPARLVPAPQTSSQPNQPGKRVENAVAMIDEPPQTTIRINIGRVEVRAVQAPQSVPPPRKTTQPPRLTIEEYAKQRSKGKV